MKDVFACIRTWNNAVRTVEREPTADALAEVVRSGDALVEALTEMNATLISAKSVLRPLMERLNA